MTVLLLTDPGMGEHAAPGGHPERPARLAAAAAGVQDAAARVGVQLDLRQPPRAADEDITRVHPPRHLARLVAAADGGGGWIDADTFVGSGSVDAARLAAGATLAAAEAVVGGQATVAFAVVRPPGHHASAARAAGFCIFNNIAIAAERLRATGRARRVAIVDWDVHHGDGTQEIYDADPDVFYASTHEWGIYPGTGDRTDAGVGAATGTKHNRPLEPGSGDDAFVRAWADELLPQLARFAPDAILVSAGYDAHAADPLARLEVTDDGYRRVAEALGAAARASGLRGVALTLEGGYDLHALRTSVAATVDGLVSGLEAG